MKMSTREQVLDHIRSEYGVEGQAGEGKNSLLVMNLALPSGRTQRVFIGVDNSILIFSPFADLGEVSPEKVFKAHDGMRHGLALLGNQYCIIANCPIKDLDPSEIKTFILLTCDLADEMEQKLKLGDKH